MDLLVLHVLTCKQQEYLFLVPWLVHEDQDLERVNVPGTVQESNWR
jgi:4-alpha-glucanotransferase